MKTLTYVVSERGKWPRHNVYECKFLGTKDPALAKISVLSMLRRRVTFLKVSVLAQTQLRFGITKSSTAAAAIAAVVVPVDKKESLAILPMNVTFVLHHTSRNRAFSYDDDDGYSTFLTSLSLAQPWETWQWAKNKETKRHQKSHKKNKSCITPPGNRLTLSGYVHSRANGVYLRHSL